MFVLGISEESTVPWLSPAAFLHAAAVERSFSNLRFLTVFKCSGVPAGRHLHSQSFTRKPRTFSHLMLGSTSARECSHATSCNCLE